MIEAVAGGLVAVVPWLLGTAGGLAFAILVWFKVGMPVLRNALLHAQVEGMRVELQTVQRELKTATEKLEAAETREQGCIAHLERATASLEDTQRQLRILVDAFQIKVKLEHLAEQLQPLQIAPGEYVK